MCAVHGFAKVFDNVTEGENMSITFSLNVKGNTSIPRSVTGMVTSQSDTARKSSLIFCLQFSNFSDTLHAFIPT